jgi:hydroxylamine reductase
VSDDLGDLQRQAAEFTPNKDKAAIGENILGLRLLCLYGLKGAAAYMEHAHVLGSTTTTSMPSTTKSWRGWAPGLPI